jgi:sterol desaturase/sphingolipid hydroxylase (fatty acid hydroxylase superfamily)
VFHRWHHATEPEAIDKNYAATFPILDILFGTYYMPEGKLPTEFGTVGAPLPEQFLDQMVYPFRRTSPAKAQNEHAPSTAQPEPTLTTWQPSPTR